MSNEKEEQKEPKKESSKPKDDDDEELTPERLEKLISEFDGRFKGLTEELTKHPHFTVHLDLARKLFQGPPGNGKQESIQSHYHFGRVKERLGLSEEDRSLQERGMMFVYDRSHPNDVEPTVFPTTMVSDPHLSTFPHSPSQPVGIINMQHILWLIFQWLTDTDICASALVCIHWCVALDSQPFWEDRTKKMWDLNQDTAPQSWKAFYIAARAHSLKEKLFFSTYYDDQALSLQDDIYHICGISENGGGAKVVLLLCPMDDHKKLFSWEAEVNTAFKEKYGFGTPFPVPTEAHQRPVSLFIMATKVNGHTRTLQFRMVGYCWISNWNEHNQAIGMSFKGKQVATTHSDMFSQPTIKEFEVDKTMFAEITSVQSPTGHEMFLNLHGLGLEPIFFCGGGNKHYHHGVFHKLYQNGDPYLGW